MSEQPTAYLVLGGSAFADPSACAFDESGEVLETVEWKDGKPDWTNAAICDHRGAGGAEGYQALVRSLKAAEENMALGGFEVIRIAVPVTEQSYIYRAIE